MGTMTTTTDAAGRAPALRHTVLAAAVFAGLLLSTAASCAPAEPSAPAVTAPADPTDTVDDGATDDPGDEDGATTDPGGDGSDGSDSGDEG